MSQSVNQVTLIGYLGADPEIRKFQNGDKVCNLRLATSESYREKNSGERRTITDWHTIAIFSQGLVRVAEQYLKKGAHLYIQGKLKTRKWQDKSGNDRYSTEVVLQGFDGKLNMLDNKKDETPDDQLPNYDHSNDEIPY